MQQRAEEADRMINALTTPATESAEVIAINGATDSQLPTNVGTDPVAPEGADPAPTPAHEPAVSGDELAALTAEVARLTDELSKANQRYSTLQGMLNARNEDIKDLRLVIANLNANPAPTPEPKPLVTEKDVEDYGQDMIDLIARVAKREVAPLIDTVQSSVDTVATVASTTAEAQFENALTRAVPDWEAINDDPNFVVWLGKYNRQALNAAYQAMDLEGTAQFFTDYKKLTAPPVAPEPVAAVVVAPVDKLEHLAAPAKTKNAGAPLDENKGRIWKAADVTKLYQDFNAKRITHAEFDKLEADLFKAQGDGRYIG